MVVTSVSGLDRLDAARGLLTGIEGGYEKTMRRALQAATRRVSGIAAREIRKHYAVYESTVKKHSRSVSVVYSHQLGVRAELTFAGHKIPLHKFDGASPSHPTQDRSRGRVPVTKYGEPGIDGTEQWFYPGIAAKGHQLASTAPTLFESAFVAKMPSGHIGIFERTAGQTSRDKAEIREIMGGSVAQMLARDEVRTAIEEEAARIFADAAEKEIMKTMERGK